MMKTATVIGLGVAVSVLLCAATPVNAMHAIVRCSPGTPSPGEYATITAALDAARLQSSRDHFIQVYGNCTETLSINLMDNVQIVGYEGATLSYPPSTLPMPVLDIHQSRGFAIRSLTIAGSPNVTMDLVRIFYSTGVQFEHVTIKDSGGSGFLIEMGSTVHFTGSVIRNHHQQGIRVGTGSVVYLGETSNPSSGTHTIVQDNGGDGIDAGQNAVIFLGGDVSVLNNSGDGVNAWSTAVFSCCDNGGERRISGNLYHAIDLRGGTLDINGALTLEDNGAGGLNMWAAYVVGHTSEGLTIRNNVRGINAVANSTVNISHALIESNQQYGVFLQDNSSLAINYSRIESNGAEGVFAASLSIAGIFAGNTISGNHGFDLFCAPDSLGRGTKAGIDKMMCPAFSQSPTPNPGPPW